MYKAFFLFLPLLFISCAGSPTAESKEQQLYDSLSSKTLLHIRILKNEPGPTYDLSAMQLFMHCLVVSVEEGTKIKTNDTVMFSRRIFIDPDELKAGALEQIREKTELSAGAEYTVLLRSRDRKKGEDSDSVFVHLKGGYYTLKSPDREVLIPKTDEYKVITMEPE